MTREYARSDVIRIDSADKKQTYYSTEGYLYDDPIVGRIGIQIYHNPDGTERKEYRPADEVFSTEAMESAKGVPIIITHDAGYVNKDNAPEEEIGTVLDVYRDGDYLRAHIVIHDTDAMKSSGLKELSLGYNLDIDDTPGEYNGEKYDCIQRHIRINHLALVGEARAGDNARLNIDSKDTVAKGDPRKGGNEMGKARDGESMDPKDFQKNVDEFMKEQESKAQAEDGADQEPETTAEKIQAVRDHKDRRDEESDPQNLKDATEKINEQEKDIQTLLDCIDAMEAESDMDKTAADDNDEELEKQDAEDEPEKCDDDDEETLNTDSVDKRITEVFSIGRMCEKLHLDGIEKMRSSIDMKKAVIRKIRPTMNLDGRSKTYINAAYDMAVAEINNMPKNADYQRRQMLGSAGKMRSDAADRGSLTMAQAARERMLEREGGNN